MKKYKKFLLPATIVIATIVLVVATQLSNKEDILENNTIAQISDERVCYIYENKVTEQTESENELFDREYIEMYFDENNNLSGRHLILPAQKDSNRATFITGVSDGTFINAIVNAQAEGTTWQEQRIYKIQDDALFVGYQEIYVPQYENEYGVYMYEDLNKIVFDTEKFFLNKVDCDSINKDTLL